jgi:lipopolysaccharide biosynthesis protein
MPEPDFTLSDSAGTKNDMQAVAFYLPQFHVIPENEAVYGKGFTEWRNVASAVPLFTGHYQPHEPHEPPGYYDLTDEKILTMQHRLACDNGVSAFCYYYYNMAGRPLLNKPLKLVNKNVHIKNSFCLCWDHTSWYDNRQPARTTPFIAQRYSEEAARSLIRDLEQYFVNPRYIRIHNRPLLLVWAPERFEANSGLPMALYSAVWREEARRMGLEGLYLAGLESFMGNHPKLFDFDCMVEFAPNWDKKNEVSLPGEQPRRIDYIKTVNDMLLKPKPDYIRMRCAFPSWDNTPRRGKHGIASVNASPGAFGRMLETMAGYTQKNLPEDHQYLFINAWNEWGEGCHLEPDKKFGFTYLDIVRDTLKKFPDSA